MCALQADTLRVPELVAGADTFEAAHVDATDAEKRAAATASTALTLATTYTVSDQDHKHTRTYIAKSEDKQPGYLSTALYTFFPSLSPLILDRTVIRDKVEGFVNDRSIMTGSLKTWDEKRLREGKLAQLHEIGAETVELITPTCDTIHGTYIGVAGFNRSLAALGGSRKQIEIVRHQSFIPRAKPIKITHDEEPGGFDAVQIDSDLFTNIPELLDFCRRNGCTAVWPDKTLVKPEDSLGKSYLRTWFATCVWSDPHANQPIYIIPNRNLEGFRAKESTIALQTDFSSQLRIFSPHPIKINCMIFDGPDRERAARLLTELKINNSSWNLYPIGDQYILAKLDDGELINFVEQRFRAGECEFVLTDLPPVDISQSGVVLASMNQTNSYLQYTHEILTFLLEGANVFFYDNARKGLSKGENCQYRMIEAEETAYEFLSRGKYFPERKILIKGQCAGGVIASVAAGKHPDSPVWIDQSPNSFQDMVGRLFVDYMQEGLKIKTKQDILSRSLRGVGVGISYLGIPWLVSKILPDIDVAQQLAKNHSIQIYTIGVPNSRGEGGDTLVPPEHVLAISRVVGEKGGEIVPISGGVHVTDWWKDPVAYSRHIQILERAGIIPPKQD